MRENMAYNSSPSDPTTANPMLSGMGPAAYADRPDRPDTTLHGEARIVPLRVAAGFFLNPKDPDPRGMTVIGADHMAAGVISDVWVDRAEPMVRYYEVQLASGEPNVLLPATNVRIRARESQARVKSILSTQFGDVPKTAHPDRITMLEEEKVQAYYAGGYLFATESRRNPLL